MILSQNRTTSQRIRFVAVAAIVAVVVVMFGSATTGSVAFAKAQKIAVFGTVTSSAENESFDVATRDGVISLTAGKGTRLDGKRVNQVNLSEITPGMSVTGYYVESGDFLIAGRLTFVSPDEPQAFDHVVGVVLDNTDGTMTVQTADGEQVEITASDNPTDDSSEPGSMIATVVEVDPETGQLDAKAVRNAQQTVERLSNAIGHEISLAQQNLLKIRMSETASVHLTRLYATLDEIQADAQAKIEAAFAEFQANYDTVLDANLIAPVSIEITGKVLTASDTKMVTAYKGNGRRTYLDVSADVQVEMIDGSMSTLGRSVGEFVIVTAIPRTSTANPIAEYVKIVPDPAPNGNGNGNGNGNKPDKDTITGTIILVENDNSNSNKVVVIENPDGSDGAVSLDPDTLITVDGNEQSEGGLEAGQEVEITLGDDGFTAESVDASTAGGPDAGDSAPDIPYVPIEYTLSGMVRSVGSGGVILDSVHLIISNDSSTPDPIEVGQEIELKVIVDEQGRWVIVGY